jgi:transposase
MKTFCGVDVSSQALDAKVWPGGAELQVENTPQGVAELATWCKVQGVELAVMEATGGYERQAFRLLWAHGVAAAVVNPRHVRRFAEAMGVLEKTDRLDAGVIGRYAAAKGVEPEAPPPAGQERLAALVTRLGQLTALKVAQENQRRLVEDATVQACFAEILGVVKGQIRRFETEIAELLQADPLWRELDRTFRQTKGVADRSVARLMAEMPEIGTLTGKEVAKLAGLAPLANDSGKHAGRRRVRGGRTAIRGLLYVVAGVVARHEPDYIAFRQKLLDAGKARKVVRIALARKLLVRLNAQARDVRANLDLPLAA